MTKGSEKATEWLGTNRAAEELRVTLRTVYRFLDEGTLPGYRFGRVLRIKAANVEEFMSSRRRSGHRRRR